MTAGTGRGLAMTPQQQLMVVSGLLVFAFLWAVYEVFVGWPILAHVDNYAYWSAWQGNGLYEPGARVAQATYLYSPAFAQLIYPLTLMPWDVFRILWIAAGSAAMIWLLWPLPVPLRWAAITLACYFALGANADWIVALGLGLSLRHPAAWAALLLTKVTPGIGVLWFAVRGEWRNLGIMLGTTAAIVLVSVVFAPHLWIEWITVLMRSVPHSAHGEIFGLQTPSLLWRLPIALALVVSGARRGWVWVLPVAALLAQADVWAITLVFFTSLPRLLTSPLAASRRSSLPDLRIGWRRASGPSGTSSA